MAYNSNSSNHYDQNNGRSYQGGSSRSTPSPPDSYPPVSPPNFSDNDQHSMSAPRAFRAGSAQSSQHSSGGEESPDNQRYQNPYSYSNPSLPRYTSGQQSGASSPNYHPNSSPLNPSSAMRGGGREGAISAGSSKYSYGQSSGYNANNGNGGNGTGHSPLSNAMYMDSSPTLLGSDVGGNSNEEKEKLKGGADGISDYAVGRNLGRTNTGGYRRAAAPTGIKAFYRALSGANLGDSGKDARHVKLPRLGYLDGCKFIAAFVVLNGTLFDAVLSSNDYGFIQRSSPLYIVR